MNVFEGIFILVFIALIALIAIFGIAVFIHYSHCQLDQNRGVERENKKDEERK